MISCMIKEKGMAISFETFPLTFETAGKLLKLIDKHIIHMFFLSDGLAKLGCCTKYYIDSKICFNKNIKDKF